MFKKKNCSKCGKELSFFYDKRYNGNILCENCYYMYNSRYNASLFPDGYIGKAIQSSFSFCYPLDIVIKSIGWDFNTYIFHILIELHKDGINKWFICVEICSGRLYIIKYGYHNPGGDDVSYDYVQIIPISYSDFDKYLSKFPEELSAKFDGFSALNWRKYLETTITFYDMYKYNKNHKKEIQEDSFPI